MDRLQKLTRALQPLFERQDVQLVVVFGSVAAGRARPQSDVDLGVLCEGVSADIEPLVMQLLGTERFDLIDLRRASPLLAMSIAKTAKVLYESTPAIFASFASLALRRYEDSAKLRRTREWNIETFLQERGL